MKLAILTLLALTLWLATRPEPVWRWPEQSPFCQPWSGVCVKRRGHRGGHVRAQPAGTVDNYHRWLTETFDGEPVRR